MNQNKAGTWIDGIAASEHLDSSGERIEVSGIDISSLTRDGVMNYEHKSDQPASIVGKIHEAKKILKRSDCENERHEHFWDKIKMPYVYVAGELFDGVGHQQAQEVAAMMRYDSGMKKSDTKKLINFSIEGSKLDKKGQVIKKCVARKVSITITPCNKACEAETMPTGDAKKSLLDDVLNKTSEFECEIMKGNVLDYGKFKTKGVGSNTSFNPNALGSKKSPAASSFKPKRKLTTDMTSQAFQGNKKVNSMKVGDSINHTKMPDGRPKKPRTGKDIYNDPDTWKSEKNKKKKLSKYDSNVRKTIIAGSGMGMPSTKVNGEAVTKSEVLKAISNENWETFSKKEELVEFIAKTYPNITEHEVVALAKTVAYLHMKKQEVKLSKMLVDDVYKAKEMEKANRYEKERGLSSKMRQKRRMMRDDASKKPKPKNLNTDQYESAKRSARTTMTMDKKPGRSKASQRELDQTMADVKHTHKEDKKFKMKPQKQAGFPKQDMSTTTVLPEKDKLAASEKNVSMTSKDKSDKGGLTQAGRDKYNRATGGNLKAPVSAKAAKKSPKKAKRRKSFCARMSGAKGKLYEYKDTDRDGDKEKVPTRKKKALDRWDC